MRIAVVCAFNPGNSGMYTVDLAAAEFLSGTRVDWRLVCPQDEAMRQRWRFGGLSYDLFRDPDAIAQFDRVVYWGDFQNNPEYGRTEFRNRELKLGYAKNLDEGFETYKRVYLLHGIAGPPKRAVSVSNNFQTLPLHADADNEMVAACLERNFRAIYPRDPVSVDRLRTSYPAAAGGNIRPGIDAALLLGHRPPPAFWRRGAFFTWYFGRSRLDEPDRLVGTISRRAGLKAVHLGRWMRPGRRGAPLRILKMRSEIRSSRLVVTDVYHVAVNALALGTPVLCIARDAAQQVGTLGDYKKHTLLGMFGLSDWLHTLAEGALSGPDIDGIAEHALRIVADRNAAARIEPVRAAVIEYRALLAETILGGGSGPV